MPQVESISFTAFGVPQPKGSARAFVPKGWTRAVVTSANPKNKGWQQLVAEAASRAMSEDSWRLATGPVNLLARFYLPRPKALKDRDEPHIKKPDLDKLVRSVKDALKQVIWSDDSQVIMVFARKFYSNVGDSPRAEIEVQEAIL